MPEPLQQLHKSHQRLARQLAHIGPVLKGSVVKRFMPCGKPNCRCQADPPQLHGPYWQWSTAVNGKTLTRRLAPEHVPLYLEWIDNRKRLEALLAKMYHLSQQATADQASKASKTASAR